MSNLSLPTDKEKEKDDLEPISTSKNINMDIDIIDKVKLNPKYKKPIDYGPIPDGISKRQFKKQKKLEILAQNRDEWKKKKKEKEKVNKLKKMELIANGTIPAPDPKPKLVQVKSDINEIKSIVQQVRRCYSINRSTPNPLTLSVSSVNGKILEELETKVPEYKNWKDIQLLTEDYQKVFEERKKDLVYLTADSENTLEELDKKDIYIIGGIVDKNRHKLLTYDRANQIGIRHAKLPIGEYLNLATRKVLTVNHVYEIMVTFLELNDWKQAFLKVIPQRKFKGMNEEELEDEDRNSLEETGEETN